MSWNSGSKRERSPLPEATVQLDGQEGGGLLNSLTSSSEDALPSNGGTVYVVYQLPYGIDFNTGKISELVDEYNELNPDAPMIFDYVAPRSTIPWMEIIFYVVMAGQPGVAVHVDVPRRRWRRPL